MKTDIKNKSGEISYYGFGCGYIERKEGQIYWKEMFMEHNHFHVRSGTIGDKVSFWETLEVNELTKARKVYKSIRIM